MSASSLPTPRLGFAAYSGTGKTTLLTRLIPLLVERGLRLGIIKHSHHDFEIDNPDKDSYRLHHAGSTQTLLTSKYRRALIQERPSRQEPDLDEEYARLDHDLLDLVLIEGFRHVASLPRIELNRPSLGRPFLFPGEDNIIALATDEPVDTDLPILDINRPEEIAEFILDWLKQQARSC